MSDIFAEVDADLRRDRWQALWDRYGLLVICGAVGIVLLVAIVVGYRAFQQSQNEAASLRYEALLQQIGEEEAGAQNLKHSTPLPRKKPMAMACLPLLVPREQPPKMAISPRPWPDLMPWLRAVIWRAPCAIMRASGRYCFGEPEGER